MTDAPSLSPTATNGQSTFGGRQEWRGRGRGRGRGDGGRGGESTPRRNRAEFSNPGPNHDRSITTIVVENIPEEKFDEPSVREFFSTFGNIVEVTLQAYKRLALVKFEDWASAKRAWESPRVIFDNRFVKVYWYKADTVPKPPNGDARASSNGFKREGSSQAPAKSAEEVQREMEEIKRKQDELQKSHEDKMKKLKETEESKKELDRRRLALLQSQAEETRKLQERLAAKLGTNAAADALSAAEPATDSKMSDVPAADDAADKKPSSQTEALKAQLAALEAKASRMGIDYALTDESSFASRGRGRGGYRGRATRGTYPPSSRGRGGYEPFRGGGSYRGRGGAGNRGGGSAYKLDNRTKKVSVSGVQFDESKDEGLRQYLLGLGEYTSIEASSTKPNSQVITFKDRFTAEKVRPCRFPPHGRVCSALTVPVHLWYDRYPVRRQGRARVG